MIAIIVFERWRVEVEAYWHKYGASSLCGTIMTAFLPLPVNDMLSEMTLYESIVDRRQWETS